LKKEVRKSLTYFEFLGEKEKKNQEQGRGAKRKRSALL